MEEPKSEFASREKVFIGSGDWCKWPNAGLHTIRVRIGSGAKSSSIHAINLDVQACWKRFGALWCAPFQMNKIIRLCRELKILEFRRIRSSGESTESRCLIKELVSIGNYIYEIKITLANRLAMGYRMLFGREPIIVRFVVDPSESFLHVNYDQEELKKLCCRPAH